MMLCDAGSLITLIDKGQGKTHQLCLKTLRSIRGELITTWPCFTEAMYFLGELRGGWNGQKALWEFVRRHALILHLPVKSEIERTQELMEKYKDVPMDLADATLVALAEENALQRIFTIDRDFYIYRINEKEAFEVIPQQT